MPEPAQQAPAGTLPAFGSGARKHYEFMDRPRHPKEVGVQGDFAYLSREFLHKSSSKGALPLPCPSVLMLLPWAQIHLLVCLASAGRP